MEDYNILFDTFADEIAEEYKDQLRLAKIEKAHQIFRTKDGRTIDNRGFFRSVEGGNYSKRYSDYFRDGNMENSDWKFVLKYLPSELKVFYSEIDSKAEMVIFLGLIFSIATCLFSIEYGLGVIFGTCVLIPLMVSVNELYKDKISIDKALQNDLPFDEKLEILDEVVNDSLALVRDGINERIKLLDVMKGDNSIEPYSLEVENLNSYLENEERLVHMLRRNVVYKSGSLLEEDDYRSEFYSAANVELDLDRLGTENPNNIVLDFEQEEQELDLVCEESEKKVK